MDCPECGAPMNYCEDLDCEGLRLSPDCFECPECGHREVIHE